MRIELYVANEETLADEARALIDAATAEAAIADVEVSIRVVRSDDEARDLRCLGSPTIRVDGRDVEYGEREPPETTAGARYYSTPEGWQRMPTQGMIAFALKEAQARLGAG